MRLFNYEAIIDWSGAANPIYQRGLIQVDDTGLSEKKIKKNMHKILFKDYKNVKITRLYFNDASLINMNKKLALNN